MGKTWIATIVVLLLLGGCRRPGHSLEVTYIGNEGYLIATGGTKILIDALTNSQYYASPSDSLVAMMMDGAPPYNDIDYLLVTHDHADHFNAGLTARYLAKHPSVQFISNAQVCSKIAVDSSTDRQCVVLDLGRGEQRTIRGGKAVVKVLRLDHGGSRETNNLAFLVTADDCAFFHVGDARLADNEEFLRAVDWSSHNIDLLFLEYFDRGSDVQSMIQTVIKPKQVVLMHIPGGEEEKVRNSEDKVDPAAVVFGREGETKRFDNP